MINGATGRWCDGATVRSDGATVRSDGATFRTFGAVAPDLRTLAPSFPRTAHFLKQSVLTAQRLKRRPLTIELRHQLVGRDELLLQRCPAQLQLQLHRVEA